MATRLEQFLKARRIKPIHLARESGYSRQHLLRLRHGLMEPTRACIAAIVSAASRLTGSSVRPEELFVLSLEDAGLSVQQQQMSARAAAEQKRRIAQAEKFVRGLEADRLPLQEWVAAIEAAGQPMEVLAEALLQRARELTFERPRAAEQLFRVTVAVTDKIGENTQFRGRAHMGRGNALANLCEYDAAFAAFDEAERILTESPYGIRDAALVWYSRGRTLMRRTDYDEALRWARRARAVFDATPDERMSALSRVLEGAVLYEAGDAAAAERLLRSALDPLEHTNDRAALASAWLDIGRCNMDLGDVGAARVWLEKARFTFKKLGLRSEAVRAQWSLALLRALHEDRAAGLNELYEARRDFEQLSMPAEAALAGLDIVEVLLLDDGDVAQAARVCRAIIDSFDSRSEAANVRRAIAYLRDALQRDAADRGIVRDIKNYLKRWTADPTLEWQPASGRRA